MPRGTKATDIVGQIFGRLTVLSRHGSVASGNARWLCACTCGNSVAVTGSDLHRGRTKSCGCLARELIWKRNRSRLSGGGITRSMVDYRELDEVL